MALKTCTGSTAQPYVHVRVRLSQAATVTATGADVALVQDFTGIADGTYSISLQATNDLTPNGTFYTVTEYLGTTDNTFNVQVPQTAGPFAMTAILVGTPTASPTPNHVSSLIVDGLPGGIAIDAAGNVAARSFTSTSISPSIPTAAAGGADFSGVVNHTGGATFSGVTPSFNGGATIRQLVFLPPPSGGDDFAVINTPLSVAKNHVITSGGSYRISATLTPATGATLEGLGFSADLNNAQDAQWSPATEIKWNNAGGAPMIIPAALSSGITIRDLGLDGNAQATKGIYGDRLMASVVENVGVRNLVSGANAVALHLDATDNVNANVNSQHNRITSFYFFTDEGIRCTGSSPGAYGLSNVCHNTFQRITGVFGNVTNNNNALTLVDSDNNTFSDVMLFRAAGTGYGVDLQAGARSEYFFHLQPSAGGVHAATPYTVGTGNLIVGYDRENGQPLPVIDANAYLDWTETGRNAAGWRVRGFQGNISQGAPQTAVASNAGGLVYHIQQDGATVIPELRIEGTGNSSFADFNMYAKGSAAQQVRARALASGPGLSWDIGTVTAHPVGLKANNQYRQKLLSAGGTQFMDAAGTTLEAAIGVTGKLDTYNGLATAGMGVAAILSAPAPSLGLTGAAASLATVTSPNDGVKHTYLVSVFCRIGTLGSASFGLQVTYTDIGGSARTTTIPICAAAGTFAAVANTADDYKGNVIISVNPNVAITVRTDPAGTYTGVTYAAGGTITQIL